MENIYKQQLELLLDVLPYIAEEKVFCLKGGTAINLFVCEMPRVSVDIDLVYVPVNERVKALSEIENSLQNIKNRITSLSPYLRVYEKRTIAEKHLVKLYVNDGRTQIKIEPNMIVRGTLLPVQYNDLCNAAKIKFARDVLSYPILHISELYAGKICAALDRQHPRDLFDIKILYENSGITDEIRQAFVVYLASGPRPMHELLNPNLLDLRQCFDEEFQGMTDESASYDELIGVRETLISDIQRALTNNEREFILSMKNGEPKWDLMPFDNLEKLPALNWKLRNIARMTEEKKIKMFGKLSDVLSA